MSIKPLANQSSSGITKGAKQGVSPGRGQGSAAKAVSEDQRKSSAEFQDALWAQWTIPEDWPYRMDLYEAAAYLKVSPSTLRRATQTNGAARARLAHQRVLSAIRFRRPDLDAFGLVLSATFSES